MSQQIKSVVLREGSNSGNSLWTQIWQLKLLPKISSFMWQATNEALPTLANLERRRVILDPICRICGDDVETQNHLFFKCRVTQVVWNMCALRLQNIGTMGSFRSFIGCSLIHYPKDVVQLMALVAWNIWLMRNKIVFENGEWDLVELLHKVDRAWAEFNELNSKRHQLSPTLMMNDKAWFPPPDGWLKLDTDIHVCS